MAAVSELVKSPFAWQASDRLLGQAVSSLLGVSARAELALGDVLAVRTVFDLAASQLFKAVAQAVAFSSANEPAGAGVTAPAEVFDASLIGTGGLATTGLAALRVVGPARAAEVATALGISTLRELALWPPYLAARAILADAYLPEQRAGFDPQAPRDLVPGMGEHPSERVFYRTLLIDSTGNQAAVADTLAIESTGAVDVQGAIVDDTVFQRMATGALLTFSQSWHAQGLSLGQLLHSLSLAPGESTRMAMVDWSRRSSGNRDEALSETEALSNTQQHNRALSEVTDATARELQGGSSRTVTDSSTSQGGAGVGADLGLFSFGASGSAANTQTDTMSATSSFGARDLAASFAQRINDSSQQNASSARDRRASVVQEVSQSEHETLTTRVVTNYNHMHTLNLQYFEVVQAFRVTSQLERSERCIFLPLKLLNFRKPEVVDRWRGVLQANALTVDAAQALKDLGSIALRSRQSRAQQLSGAASALSAVVAGGAVLSPVEAAPASAPSSATAVAKGSLPAPSPAPAAAASPPSAAAAGQASRVSREVAGAQSARANVASAGWDVAQFAALQKFGVRPRFLQVAGGLEVSASLPADSLVTGISLQPGQALAFEVLRIDGTLATLAETTPTSARLAAPEAVRELAAIGLRSAQLSPQRAVLTLQLSLFGTVGSIDVPVDLVPGGPFGSLQQAVVFDAGTAALQLTDHLMANRLHYSQAVFRSLDDASLAALLARFTVNGVPLLQWVDHRPVAVNANYLVFKANLPNQGPAPAPSLAAATTAWQAFLKRSGLDVPLPRNELVSLPSGGVFAEAVLGRANAAERLDMTRFWNWQDSPIPIVASEIEPLSAGSRADDVNLGTSPSAASLISIQAPAALPDPSGVAAIANALLAANLFRDMSGLAQSAALAQAAQKTTATGVTSVQAQAGQNLQTVLSQRTERMRIAAQLAAAMAGVPTAGGGAGKTSTEQGGELAQAQKLDAAGAASGAGAAAGGGAGTRQAPAASVQNLLRRAGVAQSEAVVSLADAINPPQPFVSAGARQGTSAELVPPSSAAAGASISSAPRAMNLQVHFSSYFFDPLHFDNAPVLLEVQVQEFDGRTVMSRKVPPGQSLFNARFSSSDAQFYLSIWPTIDLPWPTPARFTSNHSAEIVAPDDGSVIAISVTVMAEPRSFVVATGGSQPGDAAVRAAFARAGLSAQTVLKAPTLKQEDNDWVATFLALTAIGVEQRRS